MKIAISGSHGFIAENLIKSLQDNKHQIILITRELFSPENNEILIKKLESCDAIINLAGANINQRWTKQNKKTIYNSRIVTTRILVTAVNQLNKKPAIFISASAVGAYPSGTVGDEGNNIYGNNFLAKVCKDWEIEAQKISSDVRLIISRFGIILAPFGGAFPKMALPFRLYIGGKIGSGTQGISWIHIEDLTNSINFILENNHAKGVINICAPEKTDNLLFTKTISKSLNKPAWVTFPNFILRFILGERSLLITEGQSIFPFKLLQLGFKFRYPSLEKALNQIVNIS